MVIIIFISFLSFLSFLISFEIIRGPFFKHFVAPGAHFGKIFGVSRDIFKKLAKNVALGGWFGTHLGAKMHQGGAKTALKGLVYLLCSGEGGALGVNFELGGHHKVT